MFVYLPADHYWEKKKLSFSCRFLICGSIIYSQTKLKMYTCSCNVFTAEGPSERVTIVSAYRPIHCGENVLFNCLFLAGYLVICLTDQCNVERNVFWLRLLAGFLQLNFRPMYGDEGDGMLSSCLGLCYLFSDHRRIMGEMKCCLLVWVSATCFQTNAG